MLLFGAVVYVGVPTMERLRQYFVENKESERKFETPIE